MLNHPAPDFELCDQNGVTRRLADFRGNWLVVFFYPRDQLPNCTKEVCHFRDEFRAVAQFTRSAVVGINKGSVASHKRFADRHHVDFPLLSDPKHLVSKAYGAWRSGTVKRFVDKPFATRRNSYLIDPNGIIRKIYLEVNPDQHVAELIGDIQSLQAAEQVPLKETVRKNPRPQ